MSNENLSPSCGGCSGKLVESEATRDGIGRRTFIVQSALMAAAAALVACGGADTTAPTLPTGTTVKVSDYAALNNVGGVALATVSSARLAIVRTGTSSFVVLSRVCQHEGGIVNQSGNGFICPNHGAMYDTTGKWIGGQPTSSLRSYSTSYDAATGVLSIS
jgi:cytochrome b6-f complex iron-sulfur subunit